MKLPAAAIKECIMRTKQVRLAPLLALVLVRQVPTMIRTQTIKI